MRPLIPSHELPGLPSDRAEPRESGSPAVRALRKLVERAMNVGPNGFGTYGDRARAAQRRQDRARTYGPPIENLKWEEQPGALVKDQPLHVRRALCQLKSEEISDVEVDPMAILDWDPKPGMRYKFGSGTPEILETKPTLWKVPGHNPERSP